MNSSTSANSSSGSAANKAAALDQDLIDHLIADWQKERPDLDCNSMAIVGRLIHLGTLLRGSASDSLLVHKISYTDFDLLATLRRSGAPYRLTPTELTETVLLTSGAMTAALGRLESKKFIKRGKDERDGRVKTVSLLEGGLELIDQIAEVRFKEADKAAEILSEQEAKYLETILRKLTLHLKQS